MRLVKFILLYQFLYLFIYFFNPENHMAYISKYSYNKFSKRNVNDRIKKVNSVEKK